MSIRKKRKFLSRSFPHQTSGISSFSKKFGQNYQEKKYSNPKLNTKESKEKNSTKSRDYITSFLVNIFCILANMWLLYCVFKIQTRRKYLDFTNILFVFFFLGSLLFFIFDSLPKKVQKKIVCKYNKAFKINSQSKNKSTLSQSIIIIIIPIIVGLSLIFSVIVNPDQKLTKLKNQDYIELKGVLLKSNPVSTKHSRFISFNFKEYSGFSFEFTPNKENFTKFKYKINKGDSIIAIIRKEDFLKKVEGSMPLTFVDKHFNYEKIKVFGFSCNDYEYLDINKTIKKLSRKKRLDIGGWFLLIIAIICIMKGLFLFKSIVKENKN